MATISVQRDDFDLAAETRALAEVGGDVGAVVAFVGLCRSEGGRLAALEIEHYPGMAEAEIGRVAAEAEARWPLLGLTAIHRFGRIEAGANIVLVAAASAHRRAAFEAAEMMMDYLKTSAPFWKRAVRADGSSEAWVEARRADGEAAARGEGKAAP